MRGFGVVPFMLIFSLRCQLEAEGREGFEVLDIVSEEFRIVFDGTGSDETIRSRSAAAARGVEEAGSQFRRCAGYRNNAGTDHTFDPQKFIRIQRPAHKFVPGYDTRAGQNARQNPLTNQGNGDTGRIGQGDQGIGVELNDLAHASSRFQASSRDLRASSCKKIVRPGEDGGQR